jgi:hypothetical protein
VLGRPKDLAALKDAGRRKEEGMENTYLAAGTQGYTLDHRGRNSRARVWRAGAEFMATAVLLLVLTTGYLAYRAALSSRDGGPPLPAAVQGQAVATPVVPDPSECRVEPRPAAEYVTLLGTPGPGTPYPLAQPYEPPPWEPAGAEATATEPPEHQQLTYGLPPGEPAGAGAIAAITATWRELWACIAADDPERAAALFSDAGLGRIGAPRLAGFLGLPSAPRDYPYQVHPYPYHLVEARALPDGRLAAIFDPNPPLDPSLTGVNYAVSFGVFFVNIDGRWLIDELGVSIG